MRCDMEKDLSAINRENLNLNGDYYGAANYAFTLAEVLITIGVIGIVAAIALPSLINHYNDKVLETRYKKSKNILINGYKLMMAKEQVFDIKDLAFLQCQDFDCFINAHKEVFKTTKNFTNAQLSDVFADEYSIPNTDQKLNFASVFPPQMPFFQITDGMSYIVFGERSVDTDGNVLSQSTGFYVDTNGRSGPNIVGKDFFMFEMSGNGVFIDRTSEMLPDPPEEEETPPADLQACVDNPDNCTTSEQCYASNDWLGERGSYGQGCRTWYYSYDFSTGTGTYSCVNMYCR